MAEPITWTISSPAGTLAGRTWPHPDPSWLAVLVHDLRDHLGRSDRLASTLVAAGAEARGADLIGHGRSTGERGLIADLETAVDDLDTIVGTAIDEHPGRSVVLVGHGLGGAMVVRHRQRHPDRTAALILLAPVLGNWPALDVLADGDIPSIPAVPIDPATLTRDPLEHAAFLADPLVWTGPVPRTTLAAIEETLQTIDFDRPLGDELPALWLHGETDELAPVAETRAGLDRVRGLGFTERIYPNARHDLAHDANADEVLADIVRFVANTPSLGNGRT